MADPFASLAASIPDWIQRLDSLVTQVAQRQRDLARVARAEEEGEAAAAAAAAAETTTMSATAAEVEERSARGPAVAAHAYRTRSMILVYYDSYVQSFFEDLVRFVAASRNQLRKAKLTARVAQLHQSVAGMAANGGGGHRNGRMPVVDGSATGAGAEADDGSPLADDDDDGDDDPDGAVVLPPLLNYKRTMAMRSPGVLAAGRPLYRRATGPAAQAAAQTVAGAATAAGDVHDALDKGLEAVQALCEHAAHQFLRDGACGDGVATIRRRLAETQAAAAAAAAAAEGRDGQ